MDVGQPVALLLHGSSQDLGVLDLALSPWPGQCKASGGVGSKAELGGWDPLPEGCPNGDAPAFRGLQEHIRLLSSDVRLKSWWSVNISLL